MLVSDLKDRLHRPVPREKEQIVKKLISWIAAAAFAVPLLIAAPGEAQAHRYRHNGDGVAVGVAAAVIGGILLSQIGRRHHRHYYYDDYGYDDYDYGYYSRPRYYSSYSYYPRRHYRAGWGLGRSYGHRNGGLRIRGGHGGHHRHH